jgi:hypothetical protein
MSLERIASAQDEDGSIEPLSRASGATRENISLGKSVVARVDALQRLKRVIECPNPWKGRSGAWV